MRYKNLHIMFLSWYVISGPKNMEKSVVKKLADVFIKGTETPEFIKLAKDLEIYTKNPLSGDELREGIVGRDKKMQSFLRSWEWG